MQKFKLIFDLLKKVYGSRFIQNMLGTRTNVEKLPGKNDPRKVMYDMTKLADDTGSLLLAKEKIKDLAPFITKMNDSELKIFAYISNIGNQSLQKPRSANGWLELAFFLTFLNVPPKFLGLLTSRPSVRCLIYLLILVWGRMPALIPFGLTPLSGAKWSFTILTCS